MLPGNDRHKQIRNRLLGISGTVILLLVGWIFVLAMEMRKEDREHKIWIANRLDSFLERMILLEKKVDILEVELLKMQRTHDPYSPKLRKAL